MKKVLVVLTVLGVVALAFGAIGVAFADSPDVSGPANCPLFGGRGGPWTGNGPTGRGIMHDTMVAEVAKALGLEVEDLEARLADGESIWQIARDRGLSNQEISDIMVAARNSALDKAVTEGLLTQEQADWMKEHMQQRGFGGGCHGANRFGRGSAFGGMGMMRWG
ncbi:MAG: hypothetical protein ACUVWR_12355 [Anaerolineae bacterium]